MDDIIDMKMGNKSNKITERNQWDREKDNVKTIDRFRCCCILLL